MDCLDAHEHCLWWRSYRLAFRSNEPAQRPIRHSLARTLVRKAFPLSWATVSVIMRNVTYNTSNHVYARLYTKASKPLRLQSYSLLCNRNGYRPRTESREPPY